MAGHGGERKGSGRKKTGKQTGYITVCLPKWLIQYIKDQPEGTSFVVKDALINHNDLTP